MTGQKSDYAILCRVSVGTYCETHDEPYPSNTTTERTTPAIALGPTGNFEGAYRFLSLLTGKEITRRDWTELPVTASIIARVHELADDERDDEDAAPIDPFTFEWAPNRAIADVPPPLLQPAVEGANPIDDTTNNTNEEHDPENNLEETALEEEEE